MAISTVKLTFSGLLALHVKKGMNRCHVGIPRDVPHHEPWMNVVVRTALGSVPALTFRREDFARSRFRLQIRNCPQAGRVELLEFGDFSRKDDVGHENDFRWVMGFEDELYDKPIGHVKDGWLSWLRIDGGDFFTEKKSVDELLTHLKNFPGELERRGRVAVIVGAQIELDEANSRVVLQQRNGGDWEDVFTCLPVPGVHYGFDLSHTVPPGTETHPDHRRHANYYYNAVGSELSEDEKKFFKSSMDEEPSGSQKGPRRISVHDPRIDPRAICFVGDMSRTPGPDNLFADAAAEGQAAKRGAATKQHGHGRTQRGKSAGKSRGKRG